MLTDRYSKMLIIERLELIAEKISDRYFKGSKSQARIIKSKLSKLLNIPLDFKQIYNNFFRSEYFINSFGRNISEEEILSTTRNKTIKYEDACLFTYMKSKITGFSYEGLIKEIVIDEAQDYSLIQYIILRNIFKKANFTILGDINQTINPYYKYDSLEILKQVFKEDTKYLELKKTYRSSPEIIDYTNRILNLNHISAIRKTDNKPVIERKEKNIKVDLLKDIKELKEKYKSLAIITKTDEEAEYLYNILNQDIDIALLNYNSIAFKKDLIIVPSYVAKGLEFDSVIVYTKENNKYKENEKYLFYVACTRAQHELIIYNQ